MAGRVKCIHLLRNLIQSLQCNYNHVLMVMQAQCGKTSFYLHLGKTYDGMAPIAQSHNLHIGHDNSYILINKVQKRTSYTFKMNNCFGCNQLETIVMLSRETGRIFVSASIPRTTIKFVNL